MTIEEIEILINECAEAWYKRGLADNNKQESLEAARKGCAADRKLLEAIKQYKEQE